MSDDSTGDDSLAWFDQQLTLDERVALLANPSGALPASLIERLAAQPGVWSYHWVNGGNPVEWSLDVMAARRLSAATAQLDYWWQRLTKEQREYITSHRNDELAAEYLTIVRNAGSSPIKDDPDELAVVVVRAGENDHRFRLPPVVHAFVEMMAR